MARHHGSHIDRGNTERLVMPDVYRFGPKTPNWGCGTCGTDGNWASRTQAHEKEEKKHARKSTNNGNQQAIARLEEQLKAAKNENKRLAAKVQQTGKAKDTDVELEVVCDEKEAVDLDELQTLVDLSNKYFPESVHNSARALLKSAMARSISTRRSDDLQRWVYKDCSRSSI